MVHASSSLYSRAWFDSVAVNDGSTSLQGSFAQLRLLFYRPACKPSGEPVTLQLTLVRWYKHFNQASVLSSYGCKRLQWEKHGRSPDCYQVIPLACIVRREYIVPDFSRSDAVFYVSPYKLDRTVPDRRKYALTEEEQACLDEEELGLFAGLSMGSSDEGGDSEEENV